MLGATRWAPLNIFRNTFSNDGLIAYCISLLVRDGDQLVLGTRYEIAFIAPMPTCNLFTVLLDSWHLPVAFSVVEDKNSLFCANSKDRVSLGP